MSSLKLYYLLDHRRKILYTHIHTEAHMMGMAIALDGRKLKHLAVLPNVS